MVTAPPLSSLFVIGMPYELNSLMQFHPYLGFQFCRPHLLRPLATPATFAYKVTEYLSFFVLTTLIGVLPRYSSP